MSEKRKAIAMSWELIGSDRMIKTTELSDFVNTEMIIPKELISFLAVPGNDWQLSIRIANTPLIWKQKAAMPN